MIYSRTGLNSLHCISIQRIYRDTKVYLESICVSTLAERVWNKRRKEILSVAMARSVRVLYDVSTYHYDAQSALW